MVIRFPRHDESLMPITLGPMTRVPEYALHKYGIRWSPGQYRKVIAQSEYDYGTEWKPGAKKQMELVSEASIRAGFGVGSIWEIFGLFQW